MIRNEYDDVNDLYTDILADILNQGELKGKRKELPFMTFSLANLDKNVLLFPFSQRNWHWILRECSDRLCGIKNPGISFNYSKNWENRIEDSGLYSYHYSDRLNGQMDRLLSSKVHSRDKIIHVWEREDYYAKGRQPCTIIMQPFMEADDTLSMIVYMRNNDMINIFPSDIFIHSTYLKYWATKKKLKYGKIYWVSAIAYYQKKRDKLKFVERLLEQWEKNYDSAQILPTHWDNHILDDFIDKEKVEQHYFKDQTMLEVESDDWFKTDYMKEWYWYMKLYHFKKNKDKNRFDSLMSKNWKTEFGMLKESIPKFK